MTTAKTSGSGFVFARRPVALGGALVVLLLAGIGVWRFATGKGGNMIDPATYVVRCSDPKNIVKTLTEVTRQSPRELKEPLLALTRDYFVRFGREGFYDRVNNKTITAILAEYDGPSEQIVVESGEKDGLRWTLYGRRDEDNKPSDGKASEDKTK